MVNFPIDEAYLIGGWVASALWGVFTVLTFVSMYYIISKRREELFRPTTVLVLIMYALATTHVFLALKRLITAFITFGGDPAGPADYLANIGVPLNRAKDIIYITNNVLSDSVVVWRCYAVWGRNNYIIILPVMLVLGTGISGYGAIHQYFLSNPSLNVAVAWGSSMFILSFVTNVLVTLLTAGRIWYITRPQFSSFGSSRRRYHIILLLIIESGAVIAFVKIIEFTLFEVSPDGLIGNNALYIVYETMPQITGIAPTLIIAVVNAGLTSTDTHVQAKEPHGAMAFRSKTTSNMTASTPASKRSATALGSDAPSVSKSSRTRLDQEAVEMLEVKTPSYPDYDMA